jgi:hypothetical protein
MDNVLHYGQAAHSTPQSQTCVPLKGSEAKCSNKQLKSILGTLNKPDNE